MCSSPRSLRPIKKDRQKTVLVEVAGKRGTKQLITVFGDAPEENKEQAKLETCESDGDDYIFEPSENPQGESSPPSTKKEKTVLLTVLVEVAGLEPTVSSTRNWRDTNFATPRLKFLVLIPFLLFQFANLCWRDSRPVA